MLPSLATWLSHHLSDMSCPLNVGAFLWVLVYFPAINTPDFVVTYSCNFALTPRCHDFIVLQLLTWPVLSISVFLDALASHVMKLSVSEWVSEWVSDFFSDLQFIKSLQSIQLVELVQSVQSVQSVHSEQSVQSVGKPSSAKSDVFFTHCVNPCVKIYVADLYHSGGLLTT